MKKLLINGIEIKAYQIVYGDTPLNAKIGSGTGNTIGEDIGRFLLGDHCGYDFDRQSACRLRDIINDACGCELKMISSAEADARSAHSIFVGRTEMAQEQAYNAFTCKLVGEDYVVCGGSYGATWHAIDQIEAYLNTAEECVDLANVGDLSGTCIIKTVACLGDSITRGSQSLPDGNGFGAPDGYAASFGPVATSHYFEQYLSYPANLQRTLWKDWLIFNFGQGLATMRNCLDVDGNPWKFYYHGTQKYASCLAKSNEEGFSFDAVLIMLGTNDSGKEGGAKNWTEQQKADYQNEAEKLLDEISVGSPNAKFALMNVPHRCDSHKPSEGDAAIRALQKETAAALKAKGYDICHFDMNAYTSANMGSGHGDTKEAEIEAHADFYNIRTETGKPDTTHPNYRGYHRISQGVRGLLSYMLEGGEKSEYIIEIE